MEESAAVTLLIQESQTKDAVSFEAKKIVERLRYHPLAITQAGAYIRKRKLRLFEFIDHYKRRKKTILESTPELFQHRKKFGSAKEETSLNVFTTWELSFQQLQSETSEDSVEEKLLTLMAYFGTAVYRTLCHQEITSREYQTTHMVECFQQCRGSVE